MQQYYKSILAAHYFSSNSVMQYVYNNKKYVYIYLYVCCLYNAIQFKYIYIYVCVYVCIYSAYSLKLSLQVWSRISQITSQIRQG